MSKRYTIAYVLLMLSLAVTGLRRVTGSVAVTVISALLALVSLVLFALEIAADMKNRKK